MRLFLIAITRATAGRFVVILFVTGIFLVAISGCWRSTAKPSVAPPVVASPPVPQPQTKIEPPAVVPETPPAETPPPEAPAVPPPPPIPTEKMLLLSPTGPIVVEFEIWIDGQPQSQVFDELLDEVLKLADTDGDGRPMWKEVTDSPRFKYGQFGNLPIDRENAPKQILQQYDQNRNGLVDRAELPRFLTRNAGGARAFSVRSIEQYKRNRSPTWEALDSDHSNALTTAELQAAANQLKLNDADDDEILVLDELRPTSVGDFTGNMQTGGKLGYFAGLLGPHANWDAIRTALEQQYSGGKNLGPQHFRLMGEVFQQVDADLDGRLTKKEFPALNEIEPHLRLRIDFGLTPASAATTEGAEPKPADLLVALKLLSCRLTKEQTGGEAPSVIEHPGRLVLRWPGVSLTFLRNDTIASIDYEAQAQQGLTMYDTDANGYLEEKEINEMVQAQFARFEALDTDDDKRVYPGEIAAYLRQRQGAQRSQVHSRAQDQEDALFLALDQNADERLDARELETAAERLKSIDANGDGEITDDELSVGIAIVIARGSVENANLLFAIGPVEVKPVSTNLPKWFAAMDTSRDGVISSREFLGPAEKFAELDTNQNGFFEPSEIPETAAETKPADEATTADTAAEGSDR